MDIEVFAIAAGMDSALNLGSGSCVSSDGCNGVTQDHLEKFAAMVQTAERERWTIAVAHAAAELSELDEETAQAQAAALRALLVA